ncbi:HD domain-containing protein [Candidatus Woesearchaeota archaeon]|nr:HD domain-containing protein [Candidatus Woesearchaeota archaeon]
MEKKELRELSLLLADIVRDDDIVRHISALRNYHFETYTHCLRVCLYSIRLGYMNDVGEIRSLGRGALLHDVGKLDVPLQILDKKGSLSDVERKIMDNHPRFGFQRLQGPNYDRERKIAVGHHEHKKGAYPRTDSGRVLMPTALALEKRNYDLLDFVFTQIVAVADIYDALASRRSYKPPLKKDDIEKILSDQFTGDTVYVGQMLSLIK